PIGLKWRSSVWFITLGRCFSTQCARVATDMIIYSIVIPVLPFHLEHLGYSGISSLVGYLLFAYSGGLVISTPVIVWISERWTSRQAPLISGLVALICSQVMLMEARAYWVMAVARVIQGMSSSMVWTVGLALLCDTAPEHYLGQQLGLATSGLSLGLLIGPPVGGGLYSRFGFRAPFIFSITITALDLIGRLLIIERKDALSWGTGPAVCIIPDEESHRTSINSNTASVNGASKSSPSIDHPELIAAHTSDDSVGPKISQMTSIWSLLMSPRALTAMINTLILGYVPLAASQEPALPLHLQDVWGLDSSGVGLVFIAAVVPTLFSTPIAGWFADRKGAEWITILCMAFALPFWILITIEGKLPFFVVTFSFENLFTSAMVAPLTTELALVSKTLEGVGCKSYAHVYGAYNLAYGIGSSIGPIVGGRIYEHAKKGWMVLSLLDVGILSLAIILAFSFTGERPLLSRL
ncbi:major facilitator superfamily, partial [Heterobasidion irregulare TC 32-1]